MFPFKKLFILVNRVSNFGFCPANDRYVIVREQGFSSMSRFGFEGRNEDNGASKREDRLGPGDKFIICES